MGSIKKYFSEDEKAFDEVGLGETEVSVSNFTAVKRRMLPDYIAVQRKNGLMKQLVNMLEKSSPNLRIPNTQIHNLLDDPDSFRLNIQRGHPLETMPQDLINIAKINNTLTFNYKIAIKLINFLIERDAKIVLDYKDLNNKYFEVLKEKNDLQVKLQKYEMPLKEEIGYDFEDNDLELLDNEKQEVIDNEVEKEKEYPVQTNQEEYDDSDELIEEEPEEQKEKEDTQIDFASEQEKQRKAFEKMFKKGE